MRARLLRKSMTRAEKVLWEKLRRKQLEGIRFRRQHPINIFIVDFYCHQANLVIEIDGGIHNETDQLERDENRTCELENFGLKVIRFTNEEVINQTEKVLIEIMQELKSL